jgi:hypothetical protein
MTDRVEYSLILGVYRGTQSVQMIIDAVQRMTIPPSQIFIWVNTDPSSRCDVRSDSASVTVITADRNLGCHARFSAVALCDTDYVMVLDDDTVPGRRWAENCFMSMPAAQEGILGTRGIILEREAYWPHRVIGAGKNSDSVGQCDLCGHCWFFKRETYRYLVREIPFSRDTGEDIQLSACAAMEGVLTYCPPHPDGKEEQWGSILPQLGMMSGRISTSLSTEEHFERRGEVVRYWIRRGWRPMFMQPQRR